MQRHIWAYLALAGALSMGQAQGAAAKMAYSTMAPLARYLFKSATDEMELARSAAPAEISHEAQILTLGRQGYELAARCTNGFVCLVERSWEGNPCGPMARRAWPAAIKCEEPAKWGS